MQGLENVDLAGLAMMVQNSIRWSCYEDQTTAEWKAEVGEGILGEGIKAARLREWHSDFEKFCEWVVMEFAEFDEDD
jgi:adenosine deaminase CECR1